MFSKEIQFLKKLQEKAASGYVFFFQRRFGHSWSLFFRFACLLLVTSISFVFFRDDFNSLPPDGKATLVYNCIQYLNTKVRRRS